MSTSKWTGLVMLLAVSIISCKKDPDTNRVDAKLVVDLQNHLVAVSDIDSANVVLRKGNSTPYFFRLQKGVNNLEALVDGLPAGQYTADLDLYTKKMQSGKSYQFVSTRPITITNNGGIITVTGPDDLDADGWSARKVHATTDNDIIVLIPLDVNDPYFEVRTKGLNWDFFGVERLALHGQVVVAHETWTCNNDCPGNDRLIFNKTHFFNFTEEIRQKDWTTNEIMITVGNVQQQVYHEFNNVWTD
jgi:hypothetical protein